YVTGGAAAALPGQTGQTGSFLRKYDSSGAEVWTRQFGASSSDTARPVKVDTAGNVYVAGFTETALPGQTALGNGDAFVRKYNSNGIEQWTSQFGTNLSDLAQGLAVDGTGNVFVAGYTEGAFSGQTSAGQFDAFVRKYDPTGAAVWTRQFGSPPVPPATKGEVTFGQAVAVDAVGGVYVIGYTLGTLPGQTRQGDVDGFIREYDTDGFLVMTSQFGTPGTDGAFGVAVPASGTIAYVAGSTSGTLPGQTPAGPVGSDAFVMGISVPLPDLTPPVVNVTTSPAPNLAGWNNSDVTVTWSVSDPESGIATSPGCATPVMTTDTPVTGATLTCTATNGVGRVTTKSVTVKLDKTAPVVAFGAPSPAPNLAGWNNTNVTAPFTITETLSGLALGAPTSPLTLSAEGAAVNGTVPVADVAGNSVTVTSPTVKL
ncbi:MAG: SBBP repeat-containing protein, partial [Chloroflexota bacterium]